MVRQKVEILADSIEKIGPERSIDMDDAGMRLALDVVSSVSYYAKLHSTFRSNGCLMTICTNDNYLMACVCHIK